MSDFREEILIRLRACVATLAPGVVYTFPGGRTHRPIVTDLKGHAYDKARAEQTFDSSELPLVEILTSSTTEDAVEVNDDDMYTSDLNVDVWGFLKSDDAGDGKNAPVRAALNAFRADLIVAVEAFPFWTSADYPEPIIRRVGLIQTTLRSQFTEPATHSPDAYLKLSYAIRYSFTRLDP